MSFFIFAFAYGSRKAGREKRRQQTVRRTLEENDLRLQVVFVIRRNCRESCAGNPCVVQCDSRGQFVSRFYPAFRRFRFLLHFCAEGEKASSPTGKQTVLIM